jgi:hypothetical protein
MAFFFGCKNRYVLAPIPYLPRHLLNHRAVNLIPLKPETNLLLGDDLLSFHQLLEGEVL